MNKILMISLWALVSATGATAQTELRLTREECRQMALAHDERLRQEQNRLTAAGLDRQIARTKYLPQLDGSLIGLSSTDMDMGEMTMQMRGVYDAGLSLQQPLYAGGQIMAANRLARIGVESAQEQVRKTRMEVIADADNSYFTLLAVREKVKMLQAYRQQMEALYCQVEANVKAEMATQNELLRITAKRSEIDYQFQKAVNGENLCRMSLCQALGIDLQTPVVVCDSVLTATPPDGLDESIDARPELALLFKQVEAKQQQVKMERSGYLPTVGLGLGYSYYGNIKTKGQVALEDGSVVPFTKTTKDGMAFAMLSVNIPLWHWGANLKKVKVAKLELDNARLDLQRNTQLMGIEARQAVQNLTDGYRMVQTARDGRSQADENLRVMQQQYDHGLCTLTDLLDAQTQWQQARSNHIEAETQYKIYETEYLRVTGRL